MVKKFISIFLVSLLVLQVSIPVIASANIGAESLTGKNEQTKTNEPQSIERLKNSQLTENEHAGSFANLWTDGKKPSYWDLRNWANSGGEEPLATYIEDDENAIVQIDLNQTVGFFQYHEPVKVQGNQEYELSTTIKASDLSTAHSSNHTVSLRIEEFDAAGTLVNREDLAVIKNDEDRSEWSALDATFKTKSNTEQLRLILVFGTVTPGGGVSGTVWIDAIHLQEQYTALEAIELNKQSLVLTQDEETTVQLSLQPANATAKEVEWSTSDGEIVTVDGGKIQAIGVGEAVITVTSVKYPEIFASVDVKVVDGDLSVSEIIVSEQSLSLQAGKGRIIDAEVQPSNASNKQLVWKSSNESIVTVNDGVVTALAQGDAIITISAADGQVSTDIAVTVHPYNETEFDQLRKRWASLIVPNEHIDMTHPEIKRTIDELSRNAQSIWERMNKEKDRTYLWEDAASATESADVTSNYRNLQTLARAYATNGSELQGDPQLLKDIINGLDWMDEHRYNRSGKDYKNWWDWQIGSPQLLNDIVTIVDEYLTEEQRINYTDAIKKHVPDPTKYHGINYAWEVEATGANLVDLIKVVSVQGIISHDASRIELGKEHFPVVEIKKAGKGNGLYEDGSFVDHTNIAYTGTYGTVFLGSMYDMVYLLNGSPYAFAEKDLNNIYEMILQAFQPVIYRGLMMDIVNGRAISRQDVEDIGHGRGATERIIQYIEFAPEKYQSELESMVKYWIQSNDQLAPEFSRIPVISIANRIMNDDSIKPKAELIQHNNFANMDRVVHRRPGYGFAISMYSDRIAAYEGNMNGENLRAHYMGSGMTYLYNNDLEQYSDGYWPTVDSNRLPGITVDSSKQLAPGLATGKTSPQSWVGGSTMDDLYGINGMYLDESIYGLSLTGKKSWFMFNDEIVALGSNIQSKDGREIETIVENRKLTESGDNAFVVNGEQLSAELDTEIQKEAEWAHLTGNVKDSDIGYYFPGNAKIDMKREARTDAWNHINIDGSKDLITRNYLSMSINHGENPTDGQYAYVLLPNKTKEETAAYAENADIDILENNANVQAVKENKLNIMGANFWKNEKTTVERITSHHQASVMVKEVTDDYLEISVSDPTHKNNEIEIDLDYPIASALWLDPRIQVVEMASAQTKLKIKVEGAMGQTISAKFNLDPNAEGWENEVIFHDEDKFDEWEARTDGNVIIEQETEELKSKKNFSSKFFYEDVSGIVSVEYDFQALKDNVDVVMVHGENNQVIDAYGAMPIIVRASGNKFDAYDISSYKSENELPLEKGKTYHVRVEIDTDNEHYDVFITPENGEEVQIADEYRYRQTANVPNKIGQFVIQDDKVDEGSKVFNYTVNGQAIGDVNTVLSLKANDGQTLRVNRPFESQADRAIFTWSFMKTDEANGQFIIAGDKQDGFALAIEDNQLIDQQTDQVVHSNIELNKWYTVKVDLNVKTGKYTIFFGNEKKSSGQVETRNEVVDTFAVETLGHIKLDNISAVKMSIVADSLSISNKHTQVRVKETVTLDMVANPVNAFLGGLRWSSNDETIATVNRDGIVTGVSEGNVTITVIDMVSGLEVSTEVEVVAAIDKSELQSIIQKAKEKVGQAVIGDEAGQYPQESVDELFQAIADAEAIESSDETTQEAVNDASKQLQEAIVKFSNSIHLPTVDVVVDELMTWIEKAEAELLAAKVGNRPGQYPQKAYDALHAEISAAETLLTKENLTQDEVDQQIITLQQAIEIFKKSVVGEESGNNGNDGNDGNNGNNSNNSNNSNNNQNKDNNDDHKGNPPNKLPNTATDTYNYILIGMVLIGLGSLFIVIRRLRQKLNR